MNTVNWSNKSNKSNSINTNHIASKEQCEHVFQKIKAMHKASSVGFSFEIAIFLKFSLLFNIKLQISGHIFHSSGNVHTQTLLKYYPSAFFHREKDHKNIYLCLSRNLIIDVSKKSNKYLCRQFPLQVAGKTADKKFFCWQREEFLECSIGPRRPQCHPMQHGYGYAYRYRKDTDTRIRQFPKKPNTRIRLIFKK
jgi:hypothetical protein